MTGPYERRAFGFTLRSDGGSPRLVGHAAVFESDSEEMGFFAPFKERIRKGAFDEALERVASGKDDVYALLNHDANYIISSTADRTLRLSVDDVGLVADMEPMDTQTIRDLVVTPVQQGKIRKMSFGFTVEDEHEEKRDGQNYRIIDKVGRLFDVSPVTFPAYPATDVMARRLRSAGIDPDRLDVRSGSIARAFLDTFRADHGEECSKEDCPMKRKSREMEDCPEEDCPMKQMKKHKLPTVDGKAASALVAPTDIAGAVPARLRELELRDRDLNFHLGSYR